MKYVAIRVIICSATALVGIIVLQLMFSVAHYITTICYIVKVYKFNIHVDNIANLISKLNFYKLIPYPMDNSLSGRRRPARQTSEKDVLCLHQQVGP